MSGCSYSTKCPVCGSEDVIAYSDYKPYEQVNGECLECGFAYYTKVERMDFKELNALRKDFEKKPIKRKDYDKYDEEDFIL
jgi:Zn ribbon nucleic-acid-binding protein